MSKNVQKNGRFCKECGRRKFFQRFCLRCLKRTNSDIRIFISETITVRDSIELQKFKQDIKKFVSETIFGWFPTKGKLGEKLSHGVEKSRVVDRENDEYHEIVKDYHTKEIVHECHEPLSEHRK
jgi:hypothetical protein